MATDHINEYTMGRGEVWFAPFLPGTKTLPKGGGYRFLGNVPSFTLNVSSDKYEHFKSTSGVREKDLTVILQTNRTANLTLEDIIPDNLALFFLGEQTPVTQAALTAQTETFTGVLLDRSYQVGMTDLNPTGVRSLVNPVLMNGTDTLEFGVDYFIDVARGTFQLLPSSALVADGDDVTITFGAEAVSRKQTISGSDSAEGALKFVSYNAVGANVDYRMPYVQISPNGDFQLIADELQQLPITADVQTLGGLAAVYMDGQPYVTA